MTRVEESFNKQWSLRSEAGRPARMEGARFREEKQPVCVDGGNLDKTVSSAL